MIYLQNVFENYRPPKYGDKNKTRIVFGTGCTKCDTDEYPITTVKQGLEIITGWISQLIEIKKELEG